MRKINMFMKIAAFSFVGILLTGCATTAPTQYYRPASYAGEPYRIAGKLEPSEGWNGVVAITVNEQVVISKPLPFFTNTTDASGMYNGKQVSATITRIHTFMSSYIRADVFIGAEKAASLTF
ncbi:MAG: hypothetical protein ABL868_06735 [Sulfuriferula sp.]